jgi:hypothetical protein
MRFIDKDREPGRNSSVAATILSGSVKKRKSHAKTQSREEGFEQKVTEEMERVFWRIGVTACRRIGVGR